MARLKVRYLTRRTRKNGQIRYFWQPDKNLKAKGWKLTRLSDDLTEAITEAERINGQLDQWRAGILKEPTTAAPGSVENVIALYKNSREFLDLAPRTARDYDWYLKRIHDWAGDMPAAAISAKMVQDLYETLYGQTPAKAAYMVRVIRILFSFAERQSLIAKGSNPATKPKLRYRAPKGKLWSPEAVTTFARVAEEEGHYGIGTAVILNEWLGQRRGDILKLKMSDYRDGVLSIIQNKTGAQVDLAIDIIPHLKTRIEAQIARNLAHEHPAPELIQMETGGAYSADWFGHLVQRIRDKAAADYPALAGLIFKDLRQTAVTRLSENNGTLSEIVAVTGHTMKSAQGIVDRYNIRTARAARSAFIKRHKGGVS